MEYKDKPLYDRINERWTSLDTVYARLNNARETICEYFRPDLGSDYDEAADMLQLGGDIYEGSGPWSARTMATGFQGNTVSKRIDWRSYQMSDERVHGVDELDIWVQDVKKHMSRVYQDGNFYDVQPQFTLDGITTGSPVVFGEEDEERVMWIPLHFKTYRLFYNRFNESDGIIIKDEEWTAKKCFDKFCPGTDIQARLKDAEKKFTRALFEAISQGRNNDRFTIWRALFKDTDQIWHEAEKFTPPVGGKTWYDVYYEEIGREPEPKKEPLLIEGYYSKPYVVWNYDKKNWESAARTPAFEAIFDNVSLQEIFKSYLENIQQKSRPAMAILSGMKGRANFSPEGVISASRGEWNFLPKQIENLGDIRIEPETAEMLQDKLSRHFHLDTFRQFSEQALRVKRPLAVQELIEMSGEKITLLLPMIETHEGYLEQADDRQMEIESRAGRGPFEKERVERVRDILEFYTGEDSGGRISVQVQFIGTLRQAQQRQQKLQPITYGVKIAQEMGEALQDPDLPRLAIKGYETLDEALQAVNFPQKLINEKQDYDEAVAQVAKARAEQQQLENAAELMKASKGIQGEVDPNSILATVAGAA